MLTKIKKKVQLMLSAEAKAAHKIGLTPNTVSVIGFVLSLFSATNYGLSQGEPLPLVTGLVLCC